MLTSKRVGGEVEYNNGEFAEIQTRQNEGIEQESSARDHPNTPL
jgi:hypothetical protein